MKIKSLVIHNIGPIEDMTINFDCALNLFYGNPQMGKTTILNSVRLNFGGSFPNDILTHGKNEGFTEIHWDNAFLRREFYRGKDGKTKAHQPIQFVVNGVPQKKPTEAIKLFLNPFLLDQDFFSKKSELARNRYFLELFDVDVSELDEALEKTEKEASDMRIKIKSYGEIDTTPVEEADVIELKAERNMINGAYIKNVASIKKENKEILAHNEQVESYKKSVRDYEIEIREFNAKIESAKFSIKKLNEIKEEVYLLLSENKEKEILPDSLLPDMAEIDEKISDAKVQNMKYELYLANLKRQEAKDKNKKELLQTTRKAQDIRDEKINKLSAITGSCTVEGLIFNENAEAMYEGTSLGMLSMSQIMRLSSALEALYPKGFGLELIDRGESLGKSIFGFIEKAKKEESTILATIVSEEPAKNIPDDIGVWIVERGTLK